MYLNAKIIFYINIWLGVLDFNVFGMLWWCFLSEFGRVVFIIRAFCAIFV